jgi:hypothetical protein
MADSVFELATLRLGRSAIKRLGLCTISDIEN